MSRNGVTLGQVRAAKIAIESRGERVTQEKVRQELGGIGSYSTIAMHLRTLAEEELQQTVRKIDMPKELKDGVSSLVQQMWEHASSLANAGVESIRKATNESKDVLSEQLQDAIATIQYMEEDISGLEYRLMDCEADNAELRKANAVYEGKLSVRSHEDELNVQSLKELMSNVAQIMCEQGKNQTGK